MISPRLGAIKAPPPDRLRKGEGRAADYWGIERRRSLLLTFGLYCGSDLLDQPLKDSTRAYLDEARSTVSDHSLYALRPAYGSRQLSDEVLLDAVRAVDSVGRYILIDGAAGGMELRSLDSFGECDTCWLHQR